MVAAALAVQHPRPESARHEKAAGERIDRGVGGSAPRRPGSSLISVAAGRAGEPASGL